MAKSNKKLWLVLSVSGVVGIGLAIYAIKWVGEYSTKKVVSEQVNAWEALWFSARACIVGDDTTFESAGHAYLHYEATHDPVPDRVKKCEQYTRKLRRPGNESTGVNAVEKAWEFNRDAVKELTRAFVDVIDPGFFQALGERRQAMVTALDNMDDAYARLREAGGLSPPEWPGKKRPTELASGVRPSHDGKPIPAMAIEPSHGKLSVQNNTDTGARISVLSSPGSIRTTDIAAGLSMAVDDAAWAVYTAGDYDKEMYELRAADLKPDGSRKDDGVKVVGDGTPRVQFELRSAFGRGDNRVVMFDTKVPDSEGYMALRDFSTARSSDKGASWQKPVPIADRVTFLQEDYGNQRVDIAWTDDKGIARWMAFRTDALDAMPSPRRLLNDKLPDTMYLCTGQNAAWWVSGRSTVVFAPDDDSAVTEVDTSAVTDSEVYAVNTVDCDEQSVLLEGRTKGRALFWQCDKRTCTRALDIKVTPGSQVIGGLHPKDGPIAFSQTNDLLLRWRNDGTFAPLVARSGTSLHALVNWDDTLHMVMLPKQRDFFEIVPVP